MDFSYNLQEKSGILVVRLQGRLMEKSQAQVLLDELDNKVKSGMNKITLDLGGMDYMNSSGLNVLVNILTKARNQHGEVVICNVSKKIQELFLITKLNTLFHVANNEEEALKAFKN